MMAAAAVEAKPTRTPLGTTPISRLNKAPESRGIKRASTSPVRRTGDKIKTSDIVFHHVLGIPEAKKLKLTRRNTSPASPTKGSAMSPPSSPTKSAMASRRRHRGKKTPDPTSHIVDHVVPKPASPPPPPGSSREAPAAPLAMPLSDIAVDAGLTPPPSPPPDPSADPLPPRKRVHFNPVVTVFLIPYARHKVYLLTLSKEPAYFDDLLPEFSYRRRPRRRRRRRPQPEPDSDDSDDEGESSGDEAGSEGEGDGTARSVVRSRSRMTPRARRIIRVEEVSGSSFTYTAPNALTRSRPNRAHRARPVPLVETDSSGDEEDVPVRSRRRVRNPYPANFPGIQH